MPLNLDELLRKTDNLNPEMAKNYLHQTIDGYIAKRRRLRLRAAKAARKRWHLPPPSMEDAQGSAPSIGKLLEKSLSSVERWMGNSKKRSDKAAHAARCRWSRKRTATSIAKSSENPAPISARVDEYLYRKVSVQRVLEGLISPLTPLVNFVTGLSTGKSGYSGLTEVTTGENPSNPRLSASDGSKGHQSRFGGAFWETPDPRYEDFRAEIEVFWNAVNHNSLKLPWINKDEKALRRLLEASPDLTFDMFKKCLMNRAHSEVGSHTKLPRHWLEDVTQYLNGPLDRFNQPLKRRQF